MSGRGSGQGLADLAAEVPGAFIPETLWPILLAVLSWPFQCAEVIR
jgi:hypothetical protein